MHLSRAAARSAALVAVLATVAGILIALPDTASAAPKPPPNPTNSQLNSAGAQKQALNTRVAQLSATVGRLGGQVAAAQAELGRLQGIAEQAEQKVALAVSKQRDAELVAAQAKARVRAAARTVATAHATFVRYLQASYMDGQPDGTAGSLLMAKNPTALLNLGALENYQASNKVDAIGTLQRATVAKSNADAHARLAVQRLKSATAEAKLEQQAASNAVAAQSAREASLHTLQTQSQNALDTNQAALNTAQAALANLTGQRTRYLAFVAEQARLARIRAARARAARAAARAAAAAQAAAARAARHHHSGGSGGGGGSTVTYSPPVHASGGHWTAARGREAVRRARSTLGTPYAWAGGGSGGPSTGVCDAGAGAPNDCYVVGYDCSGLAMYAWGPYLSMAHYAATQYTQAGSYHPSLGNLMPGDLLFWSSDGTIGGIHHVAIYIGNGNIIQAPYSGGYVEISSMYDPGSIFGATRPLT